MPKPPAEKFANLNKVGKMPKRRSNSVTWFNQTAQVTCDYNADDTHVRCNNIWRRYEKGQLFKILCTSKHPNYYWAQSVKFDHLPAALICKEHVTFEF
jgi:hypothetical protein